MVIPSTPGLPLLASDSLPRFFEVLSFAHLLHQSVRHSRAFGFSLRHGWFGPFPVGVSGFHPDPPSRRPVSCLDFRPHVVHESPVLLAAPNRSGLRPSFPARPICCSAFRHWSASLASPTHGPTMPSADFCAAVRPPCDSLSPDSGTRRRPPEVSSTAFPAHPPDLQPRALDGYGLRDQSPARPATRCLISGFCSSGSRFCSTLPSDAASRRSPLHLR